MKKAKHKPTQKRYGFLAGFCLFAVVLFSFNGCFFTQEKDPESETLPPATYESLWTVEKSVTKHMTGTGGRTYTVTVSQENRIAPASPERARDEEICLELCAEWLLSVSALDYPLHFSLFAPQQIAEFEKNELIPIGFSLETAKLRIEEVVRETYGLNDNFRLELSLADLTFDAPEQVKYFQERFKNQFESYGMDPSAVESYALCRFDSAEIIFQNALRYEKILNDWESNKILLYRYDGVWYVEPMRLDDDISIDLVQSEKGETQGYYEEHTRTGHVTAIRNQLIFIDDQFVSPLTDVCTGLAVGDEITVTYYTMGVEFPTVGSDREMRIGVIFAVEKASPPLLMP